MALLGFNYCTNPTLYYIEFFLRKWLNLIICLSSNCCYLFKKVKGLAFSGYLYL